MQYPPEAIAAAIQNASRHITSRWRIVPLWILKVSEEHPIVPRAYLAAFCCVAGVMIVWSILQMILPHPTYSPPPYSQPRTAN